MEPVLVGTITSGQDELDTDIRDLEWVTGPEGDYLFGTTGSNGGLSVYAISPDGEATFSESKSYASLGVAADPGTLTLFSAAGEAQILVGGDGAGGVLGYAIQKDGTPGQSTVSNLPGLSGTPVAMITLTGDGGANFMVTADAGTGLLQSWADTGRGSFMQAGALSDQVPVDGSVLLSGATVGGNDFVLMADSTSQGIASYSLDGATGTLAWVDRCGTEDGLGINTPTALQAVPAFGQTWVIAGAAHSNSLSVMRLDSDGSLTATDHVLDTLDTRFAEVQAIASFETGGQVFVLAGGSDDGISLFSLLPGGLLLYRQTLVHETGSGLENVSDIEIAVTGDTAQMFVVSASAPGIARYTMALQGLGQVVSGKGEVKGTEGDDVLTGTGSGNDRLAGRKGDDVLYAGERDTDLSGGDGADIFVLRPADARYHVEDFEPGLDRLDLSLFPMLRSPAQLELVETGSGARLVWGATTIVVDSAGEGSLSAGDIWVAGFGGADRVPLTSGADASPSEGALIKGTDIGDILEGDVGNNTIRGKDGNDRIMDPGGNNLLEAGHGADTVSGGTGRDTISGGKGHDSVSGASGDDRLEGDTGSDTLWAGDGDDHVSGGDGADLAGTAEGADTVLGGKGRDTVYGGPGADSVRAGGGDDEAWLGPGRDTSYGGDGNDSIGGGDGHDLLYGDAGHDDIYGSAGNDTAYGGGEADEVWLGAGKDIGFGGSGADILGGGDGNDTLRGGDGSDQVGGGAGDDRLLGDANEDTLTGGAGADVFVFGDRHGRDVVADFQPGIDLIEIDIEGANYASLEIREKGGFAFVTTPGGDISLTGVDLAELSEQDFLFL